MRIVTRNLDIVIDKNKYPSTGESELILDIPEEILTSDNPEQIKEFLLKAKQNSKQYFLYLPLILQGISNR